MVRIGCSGWNYDAWRGEIYPEGMGPARWLREYGRQFDTVEVNSTFYRLASSEAVEKWVADTPDDFCFTVKASRYLTHVKRLRDNPAKDFTLAKGLQRFYEGIEPLAKAGKLGPTLWQLPANFRFHRGSRGRRGNYSPSELEQWAQRIASWRKSGLDVYAYFNNDWEAFAPRNAAKLEQLVAAT